MCKPREGFTCKHGFHFDEDAFATDPLGVVTGVVAFASSCVCLSTDLLRERVRAVKLNSCGIVIFMEHSPRPNNASAPMPLIARLQLYSFFFICALSFRLFSSICNCSNS